MAHAIGYLRVLVGQRACARWRKIAQRARASALACAFLTLTAVCAQTPREPIVRFTVFSPKPISDVSFTPRANAAPQKLQFYPTARSPRYEHRGPMPVRFVDANTGAVVAEATIPPNISDALLLFTAVEAEAAAAGAPRGMRYQIAVLDDGAVRHGPGGLAVINLSGLALSGTVNKEAVTLKAGLNPTMPVGASAKITLHTTLKNKPYRAYADTVQLSRNQRALLILFPPFYKGSLEVQSRLLVDQPPGTASSSAGKRAEK
jgi:hypothetical protein